MSFKVGDVVYLKPQYKSKKKLKDKINSLGHTHSSLDNFNDHYYDICDLKEIRIGSLYWCSA